MSCFVISSFSPNDKIKITTIGIKAIELNKYFLLDFFGPCIVAVKAVKMIKIKK